MENNYSNIIAPSDGVRRFLCKTSVLVVSILSAVFCGFAFRMNLLEAGTLGGTLRSGVLYVSYILFPLGLLLAAVFARVKSMGLAFSMLALLAAALSSFMLLLNSFASLLRESRMLGVCGSLLELLTFAAFFALLVNLVMSCMDFTLQPIIGTVGSMIALSAMIATSVRTMLSFSAFRFAWQPEFDWRNLAEQVTVRLRFHAAWIFRSIPLGNAKAAREMFELRFGERITACLFYAMAAMILIKFRKETSSFNRLLEHAGEYVEIPKARIRETLFGTSAQTEDGQPPVLQRKGGGSVRRRLRELDDMAKAREKGLDITDMADYYDADRAAEDDYFREGLSEDEYDVPEDAELTDEERFIMEKRREMARFRRDSGSRREEGERRRRDESGEEERLRRRRDESGEEERLRRRRDESGEEERPRRRRDEFGEEDRPRRRRDEFGEEDHPRRRRDESGEEERPRRPSPREGRDAARPRRRPERELTDQEKYLMEERRKRNRRAGSGQ